MCEYKSRISGCNWVEALGASTKIKRKKWIFWMFPDSGSEREPVTTVRALVIPVTTTGIEFCNNRPKIQNHEISQVMLMSIDPFLENKTPPEVFIRNVHGSVLFKHWITMHSMGLGYKINKR